MLYLFSIFALGGAGGGGLGAGGLCSRFFQLPLILILTIVFIIRMRT